jgi:putative nucleotidyltransferase with HDIG domain
MKLLYLMREKSELFAAPQAASKLSRLLKASPFDEDVIAVVQHDPALTARVLQVCNSALYRGNRPISSIQDAIRRLGFERLLRIVWQLGVGRKMNGALPVYSMAVGVLWRHSVTAAIAADELWKWTNAVEEDPATAFTAALLHDVGKVILNDAAASRPADYGSSKIPISSEPEELDAFGETHAEAGADLLRHWRQAEPVIHAVAGHHAPGLAGWTPLACLVHLANVCAHAMTPGKAWKMISNPVSDEAMRRLDICPEDLVQVREAVMARVQEIEVFMSIV